MKSKCCHCLFRVGLQLSLDVGSVGGGHACFQSSCGLWRVAMLSSTRWCWQRSMYPPRWLQEGHILSPDPVKMADWKLFSGSRPHRSSLHFKKSCLLADIWFHSSSSAAHRLPRRSALALLARASETTYYLLHLLPSTRSANTLAPKAHKQAPQGLFHVWVSTCIMRRWHLDRLCNLLVPLWPCSRDVLVIRFFLWLRLTLFEKDFCFNWPL